MSRLLATRRPDGLLVPVAIRGSDGLLRPAGEGCKDRCCGECWRAADPCPPTFEPPPGCPQPPDLPPIYVNCAARCEETGPIPPGTTFIFGEHCYTLRDSTIPFADIPADATLLDETAVVECVAGCADIRCPQDALWVEGIPCDPELLDGVVPPSVLACELTHCIVGRSGGCWLFDPANAANFVPLLPRRLSEIEIFTDCCECNSIGPGATCSTLTTDVDPCDPESDQTNPCCCDPSDTFELVSFRATLTEHRVVRTSIQFGGGSVTTDAQYEVTGITQQDEDTWLAHVQATQTSVHRDANGVITFVDGPTDLSYDMTVDVLGCPHLRAEADTPFGFGFFTGGSLPCTYSVPRPGGAESVTTFYRRTCLTASYSATGSIEWHEGPASPGDGSFDQSTRATMRWEARRVQGPGPCRNGCGSSSPKIEPGRPGVPSIDRDLGSGLGGFL